MTTTRKNFYHYFDMALDLYLIVELSSIGTPCRKSRLLPTMLCNRKSCETGVHRRKHFHKGVSPLVK